MLGGLKKWITKWLVGVENVVPYKFYHDRVYNILESNFRGGPKYVPNMGSV